MISESSNDLFDLLDRNFDSSDETICKKIAVKSAPIFSLQELLTTQTNDKLKHFCKKIYIHGYSTMKKSELVDVIIQKITDIDYINELFLILDEEKWQLFEHIISEKVLHGAVSPYLFITLNSTGIIWLFYDNGDFQFIVPDEIKKAYEKLLKTGFPEKRKLYSLLNTYAKALTNFYGFVTQDYFIELFNSQNDIQIDNDTLFNVLINFVYINSSYCFYEEYIVSDYFSDKEFEDFDKTVQIASSKPRYIPSKEELLKFSDFGYFEITPQLKALEKYTLSICHDQGVAQAVIDDVQLFCSMEEELSEILGIFDRMGVSLNYPQMKKAVELINDVWNNTRMWINNGHTPNELGMMGRDARSENTKTKKIGRNDPCPCGSGKKYKKCCGRV